MRPSLHKRSAFTLIQTVVVLGIILFLGTWGIYQATAGRAVARQMRCSSNCKSIALAIGTYRQEVGRYPASLGDLTRLSILRDPQLLHCPDDPDADGTYAPYYIARAPQDAPNLPMVLCPFHQGRHGVQTMLSREVHQFVTQPAVLTQARDVTVQRYGAERAVAGVAGMMLSGADIIMTGSDGSAVITFADSSTATVARNSQIRLLQSYTEGQAQSSVYSVVRQVSGSIEYRVNHGSKFDVATPTAVAGALGTRFTITITPGIGQNVVGSRDSTTTIFVSEGRVRLTTIKRSALAPLNRLYTINGSDLSLPGLTSVVGNVVNTVTGTVTGTVNGVVDNVLPGLPGLLPGRPGSR